MPATCTSAQPMAGGQVISDATADAAAERLTVLMSGEASDEERRRWQQWRASDPEHERAWLHIEAVMSGRLGALHARAAYQTLSPYAGPQARSRRKALRILLWGGATSVSALLVSRTETWQSAVADFRSATGEQRVIALSDGTEILLNTTSAIDVQFDGQQRLVRLVAGEIMVVTGHPVINGVPDGRPFIVQTCEGQARALGTRGFVSVRGPGPGGTFDLSNPNAVPEVDVPCKNGSKNRMEQYSFYTQGRLKLADPLTLVLGAREAFLQQRSQTIIPTAGDWETVARVNHRFLPNAGLVWDITPAATAYASYSRFLTAQTSTRFDGSMLPLRTGEQYEVGLKSAFFDNRLNTTVALFRINDDNRTVSDPDHALGSIPGGRARNQGVEVDVSGEPLPNRNVYAGYTYLNVKFDNDSADLTDGTDPKHLFKLWTNYRISEGALRDVTIGGGMLTQSAIYRGVTQSGYAIFNAQLGYKINQNVDVALQLNNIFNRDYYIRPPGRFFSVVGDGRNAMLTLRYHI